MTNSNIALCFYGEARHWQVGAETISKFRNLSKDKFNIDVFCHLWDNITYRSKNIRDLIKQNVDLDSRCVKSSNLLHGDLLEQYKPVQYKIESKDVLDYYVDKFNPTDNYMTCDEYKLAIKYSNTPCFSQVYSTAQSFFVLRDYVKKNPNIQYDLIIMLRTDCSFDDRSIIDKTIEFYCKYVNRKDCLLVERLSLVPKRREPWIYNGYMLGTYNVFDQFFDEFPKTNIGMGQYKGFTWRGSSHAEVANYLLNYTAIQRVWPILIRSHPWFVGKYKQFNLEKLSIN